MNLDHWLTLLRDKPGEGEGGNPPADPPAGDPPPSDPPADPPADPPKDPPKDPPADPVTDWRDTVAAGVNDDQQKKFRKQLDKFADQGALGLHLLEMQKTFDKRIAVPGDDATDEDRDAFAEKMGWVSSSEDYANGYERPEFANEAFGKESLDGVESEFFAAMHERRIPKDHAVAAIDGYYTLMEAQEDAFEKKGEEMASASEASLKEQFGDDYEVNMKLASRYAESAGVGDLLDMQLRDGGTVGDLVPIVTAVVTAARSTIAEDNIAGATVSTEQQQTLMDRLDAINQEHFGKPTYNSNAVQREIREINEKLYGTAPADGRMTT